MAYRRIFDETRSIAMVGASDNPERASHSVGLFLVERGFELWPVNPKLAGRALFGRAVAPSLAALPAEAGDIDMVDIFRRSEEAGAVVDEAIEALMGRGLDTIWMQLGVEDAEAAARAEARGLTVVMNACPKIEWREFGAKR